MKIEVGIKSFSEVKNYTSRNSAVLIATTFPNDFDFIEVDTFLSKELKFSKGKNLIGIYKINGNILGANGRTDWLMVFDNEKVPFNPIARLRFPDIKWTEDFIDNYGKDYEQ